MKKLIIFVLTILFLLTSILLTESVYAELVPITPFYEGDILNGKELYLFQDYTSTPNFENGYISKKTISSQDVYYQENSNFNGWYKDLGKTLIDEYTAPEHEPENPYFVFYIVFNGMLGQYLQLGLISQEPYVSTYHIKYKNENAIFLMDTDQYNQYLIFPPTGTQTKEIEWISYDVYYPDILASFKPLTADIAYQFGFDSGEMEGYNNGYNTGYSNGYNIGHTDGYNEGSIDTQYGVNTVVNFNQLAKQLNNTNWIISNIVYNTSVNFIDNVATLTYNSDNPNTFYGGIYQNFMLNPHKYLITFYAKTSDINTELTIGFENNTTQLFINTINCTLTTSYEKYNYILDIDSNHGNYTSNALLCFYFRYGYIVQNSSIDIKNVMCFDLTQIYGVGNEPTTIEQFKNDFPSDYYSYTTSDLINIDYENGYIKGQKLGYNLGYDDGISTQATKQLTSTGWIQSIFGGISSLLNIQLFPGVTIGLIVGIPFIISLAYFVIRAFRGGGGA